MAGDIKKNAEGPVLDTEASNRPGKAGLDLCHNASGQLVLTDADGRDHVGVEPVRSFPVSDPRHHVALVDAEGRQVAWIEDLDRLPAPLRQLLEEHLAQREFMPVIQRVVSVSAPVEPAEWEVDTDRGRTRFILNGGDDVRRLGESRVMIIDARGIRYLVADTLALDATSRRLLERYL